MDSRAGHFERRTLRPAATWNEAERLIALARYTALDALHNGPRGAGRHGCRFLRLSGGSDSFRRRPVPALHGCVRTGARSCRARTVTVGLGDPSGRRAGSPHTDTLAQFELPRLADGQTTGFYVAVILRSSDGLPLGTMSVFDHQPANSRRARALSCWRWRARSWPCWSSADCAASRNAAGRSSTAPRITPFSPPTCRAASPAGTAVRSGCWAGRRRKPSAATWRASSAKPIAPHRSPGRNAHGAGAGACRRRTLASAQGRLTLLGQRHPPPLLHDGQTQGFVKILRDLTESRQQQAAARETEERYRALVDLSPQIIWQCGCRGWPHLCNSYWCEFTGLGEASSTGEGWLAAVSTSDRQRVAEQWQAALRRELPFKLELPLRDVDGNLRWFQANAAPTYDADGQLLRWVCVAQDIDSRRRSEMQRLESEAFTRLLLDSANEASTPSTATAPLPCNDAFLKIPASPAVKRYWAGTCTM